jgi:hypothetical protein
VNLDFVRIECEISADSSVPLTTVLYNAVRNFEERFRMSCCLSGDESCTSCGRKAGCPYRIIFNQKLSSDPEIVRLHQKPSLPFSLYIRGMDSNASSSTIGIVVIGSAVNYVEYFHSALLRMIEKDVCAVLSPATCSLRFYSLDYQGLRHEIALAASLPESIILLSGQHVMENTVHSDSVRLSLISPLRLLSNGSIAHHFDFDVFFRSQLRRCSSICSYYGTGELDLDFTLLSEAAKNITVLKDKTRYSLPHWSKRLNRAGLTGTAECSGLIEPMFSLLLLGSFFNAGKGAAFGSGFYQLEVL